MKIIAIIILIVALNLLYWLAFRIPTKSNDNFPEKDLESDNDIIGKSKFRMPTLRNAKPDEDSPVNAVNQTEKADIFAAESDKNKGVIPTEAIDEVFVDTSDLDIEPDDEPEEIDIEEEAEELRQTLGGDATPADGLTFEEMAEAIGNPSDEQASTLFRMEQTDLFEQLLSSNEEKAQRIKAIIDRHLQKIAPEEPQGNNNEYGDFEIADYVS